MKGICENNVMCSRITKIEDPPLLHSALNCPHLSSKDRHMEATSSSDLRHAAKDCLSREVTIQDLADICADIEELYMTLAARLYELPEPCSS